MGFGHRKGLAWLLLRRVGEMIVPSRMVGQWPAEEGHEQRKPCMQVCGSRLGGSKEDGQGRETPRSCSGGRDLPQSQQGRGAQCKLWRHGFPDASNAGPRDSLVSPACCAAHSAEQPASSGPEVCPSHHNAGLRSGAARSDHHRDHSGPIWNRGKTLSNPSICRKEGALIGLHHAAGLYVRVSHL